MHPSNDSRSSESKCCVPRVCSIGVRRKGSIEGDGEENGGQRNRADEKLPAGSDQGSRESGD